MKRTLLAVGIAVLASMMLIPRGDDGIHIWLPFFYDAHWLGNQASNWEINWDAFILQTVFAAVFLAVLVNLLPRRPR